MATFTGQKAKNNTFTGTAAADTFRWAVADLDSLDRAAGAGGVDVLQLTTGGPLASTALTGIAGIEQIALSKAGNSVTLLNANFAGVAGARIVVTGGAGNDTVSGSKLTGTNRIEVTAGLGTDVLKGGAGADVFRFTAAGLTGSDQVSGGGGRDVLAFLTGGALVAGALAKVTGVETIQLSKAGNAIALTNANFAGVAGATIQVRGSALGDRVDGSGLTGTRAIDVTAGTGADVLTGGAGRDVFRFKVGDMSISDMVQGGGGSDTLLLTTAGAITAGQLLNVTGVETIRLANGTNMIALSNANFAGVLDNKITVLGGAGGDGVDASALTGTSRIDVTAGLGADVLKGGAGRDVFRFTATGLAGDTVVGGGGTDLLRLTTAGTLTATALANVSGVESIALAAGTSAIKLKDANFAGVTDLLIKVAGGSGNSSETVDASMLTGARRIEVTAGLGTDVLKGGAGDDVFRFSAKALTSADTVQGGSGSDLLLITTSGALAADALTKVTGIEQITLAAGGNQLTLTDANFAAPVAAQIIIFAAAGNSSITGSDLTGTHGLYMIDGGGIDTITGGAGADSLVFGGGNKFRTGDSFDGRGGGNDIIFADRSMDFLGTTISNVEQLVVFGTAAPTVITISGENAAGFKVFGSYNSNGLTDTFNVRLSAGSTTDLSNLSLFNADAADAINVVAKSGSTTVTLSSSIASFTGSADDDTVLLGAGGSYLAGAVINGGGGDDRITYNANASFDGGTGNDTLVLLETFAVDLRLSNQVIGGFSARNFENIDASASNGSANVIGRNDVVSVLIGSSTADTLTAGAAGAIITGGLGADILTGDIGDDRFHISSTPDAQGDSIDGAAGDNGIDVQGDADLTGATITNIQTLYLAAGDAAGTISNADLTATVTGAQAEALTNVFGNGYNTTSTETLVVTADSTRLDLSKLAFYYWSGADYVVINGTSGYEWITGTSVNDVIDGGGGDDILSGGDGDDVIGFYLTGQQALFGGKGNDTVKLNNNTLLNGVNYNLTANLDIGSILVDAPDITFSNPITTDGFENVDLSANFQRTTIIGSDFDNVLIGGSDADTITGGLGADTLTGNGGAESFVWNNKIEGGDTITDFVSGTDKLAFAKTAFSVNGAFDTLAFNPAGSQGDITTTDLLYVGDRFNTADELRAYLDKQSSSVDHGMFVLARNSQDSATLYYTSNVNGLSPDSAVFEIADLGVGGFDTGLGDFVLI